MAGQAMKRLLVKPHRDGLRWLLGAYTLLAVLGVLDAYFGPLRIGVLAVIPLLMIGFFGTRALAFSTAIVCAAVFALLDNDIIRPMVYIKWNVQADAALFAIMFVAILVTAERLRASEFAAASDVLTSLPNRRALDRRIHEALARANLTQRRVAVLFVDLDHFKEVNDRYGHAVGDRVLQHVAERLMHTVRTVDTVGRVGGDEFVIVLEEVVDRADAQRIAASIEKVLSEPYHDGNIVANVGATVGISLFPADAADATALLRLADAAMYERKRGKRVEVSAL
jgi:diguanylate cyclase (GGDEF)-like protein